MNCKISIILPVYNVASYLEDCLKSLVSQSLKDIEIIAINDGSTDNSLSILNRFQSSFPDKLFVHTIENHGVSHARNLGLSLAHGEYIWFIDSDDYIEPDACEKLYQKASSDGNDLVLFRYYTINMISNTKNESAFAHFKQNFRLFDSPSDFLRISPFPWNKLIRRDLIEGLSFPEGMRFEDLPIAFLLSIKAQSIGVVNECLYDYRSNVGFLNQLTEETLDIIKAIDLLKNTLIQWNLYEHFKKEIAFVAARHFIYRFHHLLTNFENGKYELKCRIVTELHTYLNHEFPKWKQSPYLTLYLPDYVYKHLSFYTSEKELLRFLEKTNDQPEDIQRKWVRRFRKKHGAEYMCTAKVKEPPTALTLSAHSSKPRILYYYAGKKLSDKIIQDFNYMACSQPEKEFIFAFNETEPGLYMNRLYKLKPNSTYIMIPTEVKPTAYEQPQNTIIKDNIAEIEEKLNSLHEKEKEKLPFLTKLQIHHLEKNQVQKIFGSSHFSEVIIHSSSDIKSLLLFHYMEKSLNFYIEGFNINTFETIEEYNLALKHLELLIPEIGKVYLSEKILNAAEKAELDETEESNIETDTTNTDTEEAIIKATAKKAGFAKLANLQTLPNVEKF